MTYDLAYLLVHLIAVPAWLLLFLAPRAALTRRLVHSAVVPLALGIIYAGLVFAGVVLGRTHPGSGVLSLDAVIALLTHPNGALAGWIHYLIHDLFIGAWIARDADRRGIPHAANLPALMFAFAFGPIGLMIHLLQRRLSGRAGFSLEET
jgi:hypothetical protein